MLLIEDQRSICNRYRIIDIVDIVVTAITVFFAVRTPFRSVVTSIPLSKLPLGIFAGILLREILICPFIIESFVFPAVNMFAEEVTIAMLVGVILYFAFLQVFDLPFSIHLTLMLFAALWGTFYAHDACVIAVWATALLCAVGGVCSVKWLYSHGNEVFLSYSRWHHKRQDKLKEQINELKGELTTWKAKFHYLDSQMENIHIKIGERWQVSNA